MKNTTKLIILFSIAAMLIYACSSNDDTQQMVDDDMSINDDVDPSDDDNSGDMMGNFEMTTVQAVLPEGVELDLSTTSIASLGEEVMVDSNGMALLPFNSGTVELGYLLDEDNNVLLLGFLSDQRTEISVTTTAEVMLYFGLDYFLLDASAKTAFLDAVPSSTNFDVLVSGLTTLFEENPLMYAEGIYLTLLNQNIEQLTQSTNAILPEQRIFLDDVLEKSGITFNKVDESTINLQNTFPRRSRILVYRKSFFDREGNLTEIPNFRENEPLVNLLFEPGKTLDLGNLDIGTPVSVINANAASIDNATESGPIVLPVNTATEFAVEYEVVVIGSGTPTNVVRDFTERERDIYGDINEEAYILDYFLPALLDIGGNKALLQNINTAGKEALVNAVSPVLEQYPEVLENVRNNEFKDASETWFPELYENIRLSDDLRNLLGNVYNILTNNGNSPNTFIQSQELAETGIARTERVMAAVYGNMDFSRKSNIGQLRTTAKILEQWQPFSIDAEVGITATNTEVCLGEAQELRATLLTISDAEVESLEFHWSSSNRFGGRIQDINGDPNNFGTEIVTENNAVSYISAALESDLDGGSNIETITVTIMARNLRRNDLTEIGTATIDINNVICESFTASVTQQPNFRILRESALICNGNPEYQAFSPVPFSADFEEVEGAVAYDASITFDDGLVGGTFRIQNLEDLGGGLVRYNFGIGSIVIVNTCNEQQARDEAQNFVDNLTRIPVSIEITPIF